MYTEAKVLLRIELQGGTLIRESKVTKIEWALTLGDLKKESKKKLPEKIAEQVARRGRAKHYALVAKPAAKVVTLGIDAYEFMTSAGSYESWMLTRRGWRKRDFIKMDKEVRLLVHLERLCEQYGGKNFTYQVLE